MSEKSILFNGLGGRNFEHFLFHFKNVTEPIEDDEQKARTLINYLRGRGFLFYYEWFPEETHRFAEMESYENVKIILRNQLGRKKNATRIIERALGLKLRSKKSVEDVTETATKRYDEVVSTVDQ